MLLQKTLLNVEGMGRDLDPGLDLWQTAKPFLEKWMRELVGLAGLRQRLDKEAAQWVQILPQLPRLVHGTLARTDSMPQIRTEVERLRRAQEQTNRLLMVFAATVAVAIGVAIWALAGQ